VSNIYSNYLLELAYVGKKLTDLYYSIYLSSFLFFLHLITSRPFPSILIFMLKTFRMLLKRHIVRRAIWLFSHREKEDYSWLPSSPGGRTLRSSFLSCLSASSSRNAIIILSYDNGVVSRSGAPKNVESRGAKIHGAKMPTRKLT